MKKKTFLSLLVAFSNSWKMDDNGAIVMKDGNPVYIDPSGREMVVAHDTIARLNSEAKSHREAKEEALSKLKLYEGLEPEAARKALETVSKLNAKELIESGKVDELKNQITQQFSSQLAEKENALKELTSKLDSLHINNVFANSEFIRNSIAVPRDMFEATFRNNFKVENGQVVAYGKDGNRLFSKTKAGEYADAEESLQLLVDSHPQKDIILRADVKSGTGNSGAGGNYGGVRSIKRSEFESLGGSKKVDVLAKIRSGEMKLTD